MCMDYIFQEELKSVKFEEGVVAGHAINYFETPKLILNECYRFQHLMIHKGKITPIIYPNKECLNAKISKFNNNKQSVGKKKLSEQLENLSEAIPPENSPEGSFARVVFRNVSNIRDSFHLEKQQLLYLKDQALLESESLGDETTEHALMAIDTALELLATQESKFECALGGFVQDKVDYERSNPQPIVSEEFQLPATVGDKNDKYVGNMKQEPSISKNHGNSELISGRHDFPTNEEEEIQLAIALAESMTVNGPELKKHTPSICRRDSGGDGLITNIFQCSTGLPVYLHPLCTQCILQQSVEDYSRNGSVIFPEQMTGKVIDIERVQLGDNNSSNYKSKYRFLKHLPKYSEVYIVELEMKTLVTSKVLSMFKDDFAKLRAKKAEKQKHYVRERKLDEEMR